LLKVLEASLEPIKKRALLVVDIQKDFLPGGSMGVAEGNDIIPILNELMQKPFDLIVATKDWHPQNHVSFAENHLMAVGNHITLGKIDQILWPVHCVQEGWGSEFPLLFKNRSNR
jgi:nicotinamidase/pyrazinamidase